MSTLIENQIFGKPYWLENVKPVITHDTGRREVEVIVIGAGYAGLSAALRLAQDGIDVLVLEGNSIGDGASSRSAGSVGHIPKASLSDLKQAYGSRVASNVYREAVQARKFVEHLVSQHNIDCKLRSSPRFVGAHSQRSFRRLAENLAELQDTIGDVTLVQREEQEDAIGSSAFYGGLRVNNTATLQPALLHAGLAGAALSAGVRILQNCRVTAIDFDRDKYEISVDRGSFKCRKLVVATNAETGFTVRGLEKFARRLAVVPAFALATEPLPQYRIREILKTVDIFIDTYKILHYMAINESGDRFIMSGRAGFSDRDLKDKAEKIFSYFERRFPHLSGVGTTHCWTGKFAFTGDFIPHIGHTQGMHYVLGCCGTGITMATYLGNKVALQILGDPDGSTVFDRPLPPIALWRRTPTMLAAGIRTYSLYDRFFR